MFHTVKRLIEDIQALRFARSETNGLVAFLGGDDSELRERWVRLAMQVFLSLAAVALCVSIILSPEASEGMVEAAHTGLGTVLGYWLR